MSRRPPSRSVRVARGALWALAAAQLAQAALLRQRRDQIEELAPLPGLGGSDGDQPVTAPAPGALPKRSRFRSVTAVDVLAMPDVEIDEVTLAEVADLMERTGIEVIDLVPGDLPVERLLRWLERVDPARLAEDVLYAPLGAQEALALRPDLARRMASAPPGYDDVDGVFDRGRFARLTRTAYRYAPGARAVRIAPRLHASAFTPHDRWRELQEVAARNRGYGELELLPVGAQTALLAALTVGPLVGPAAGLAALAAWSARPLLVLAGHRPAAELLEVGALRLVRSWADNVALWRTFPEVRRPRPTGQPTPPMAELFEPRVDRCPWCGSAALVGRLDAPDLLQRKPGTFHLDECTACGHIFQNPRLSLAGLDHYYEDFYDGHGEERWEESFAVMGPQYDGRVDLVAEHTEPQQWLDVGTGHGHFCLTARQRWPKTRFEGLDLSESVFEAERRGWIDQAHHGLLVDLAPGLAGSYDVVSMNHYLEHTREPRDELAAAATVLATGGYLLIEGPDSASPWSRLGRYWRCWFQPQHQHFITCENLVEELERIGFEVVAVQRAEASEGRDLFVAASLLSGTISGPPRLPWLPEPSALRRATRPALMALMAPVQVGALMVDLVKDGWQRRPGSSTPGNAYRVLARRR